MPAVDPPTTTRPSQHALTVISHVSHALVLIRTTVTPAKAMDSLTEPVTSVSATLIDTWPPMVLVSSAIILAITVMVLEIRCAPAVRLTPHLSLTEVASATQGITWTETESANLAILLVTHAQAILTLVVPAVKVLLLVCRQVDVSARLLTRSLPLADVSPAINFVPHAPVLLLTSASLAKITWFF